MIRNVNLLEHLPQFVQEYKEIQKIMKSENPEIQLLEDETEVILNNQFIKTCNLKGIEQFENLMGITPLESDDLEARISRVLTRWNDVVPYTFIILCQKLNTLCGKNNYEIIRNINEYKMNIVTHLELSGQTEELDYILNYMIPANISITSQNKIAINLEGTSKSALNIAFTNLIEISDNFKEEYEINNDLKIANIVNNTAYIEISDNFKENINVISNNKIGSNMSLTEII